MPTKRRRRTQKARIQLTPALRHFLETGCYHGGNGGSGDAVDFDVFVLAGAVIRGYCDKVRQIWREHQAVVKQDHRGETYAESILRWDTKKWATPSERFDAQPAHRCREHEQYTGGHS